MKRLLPLLGLLALASTAEAQTQSSDAEYCGKLAALAYKFVSGGGGEGKSSPDLNTLGAIDDCNKGKYDKGIPYLEKRLRDSRVTLPPR